MVGATLVTNTAFNPPAEPPNIFDSPNAVIVATSTLYVAPKKVTTAKKITAIGVIYSPSIAHELSDFYADKWGVSREKMWSVIMCEDPGLNPYKQSGWHYTAEQIARHPDWGEVGDQEKSYGLVQIHLPGNRGVSYAQATDPDFALNFLAQRMSEGRGGMWTCWA